MSSEAWYVIESDEGKAKHAYLTLAVAKLKVWMPMILKRDLKRGKDGRPRRDIYYPRFGRYFFVQCDLTDEVRAGIAMQPSVRGLLTHAKGANPHPLPQSYIDWLREGIDEEKRPKTNPFSVGDTVRPRIGPFAGFESMVRGVDNPAFVKVDISIFGRPTPALFEVGDVELVRAAKSRTMQTPKMELAKAS